MSDVVAALRDVLGAERVRIGSDVPARNAQDATFLPPVPPRAVVLPRSTEEVASAVQVCASHGAAIVTQGGMTGLAGGAHPGRDEIAISLERMSGIEEIDREAGTLTALAGTPLAVIQHAAEEAGFLCGIDLGARGTCTIGGNVATNAGGNHVLRYGMTRRNVLGLEVVLADGTIVRSLNKMTKNNAGYDWKEWFLGSEGTLGIVTRVVLQLHPPLGDVQSALVSVDGMEAAVTVLRRLSAALPAGLLTFEMMSREFMDVASSHCGLTHAFTPAPDVSLLVEAPAEREAFETVLADLAEAGLVRDALVARSGQDRARFWAFRESPYEYATRGLKPMVGFDVSVPIGRMGEALARLRRDMPAAFPDAVFVIFGHVADSNLHINVHRPVLDTEGKTAVEKLVYDLVVALGGSVSAEHGIGRTKKAYLPMTRGAAEIDLMRRMKAALDPAGTLNPGRVV